MTKEEDMINQEVVTQWGATAQLNAKAGALWQEYLN